MKIQLEMQLNPVADPYSALLAVVRPMLSALLYSARGTLIDQVGGYDRVSLEMLSAIRNPHDGELGICFEYAVHDAIRRNDPMVAERVVDSLRLARIPGTQLESILFGAEKKGAQQLIDTAKRVLTPKSKLLYGKAGRPLLLSDYITEIAQAFRNENLRLRLPGSIRGLWKADLFLGYRDQDCWVGTTVKINAPDLEPAEGLRVGIVPLRSGAKKDVPYKDDSKNLIVCPLRHDHDFMQVFYTAWRIVAQVMEYRCKMPKESAIPDPLERQIAKELVDRAPYPVLEVIDALKAQAQPHLLDTTSRIADIDSKTEVDAEVTAVVAPISRVT
jgi:hypothetical protein